MNKKLSIAILGTRGVPNRYGGFEACAEEIGMRLVQKGHRVSVYCPHDHPVKDSEWMGMERIILRNPENLMGTAGQFIYDLNCNLDSHRRDFDVILHLGYTSDSVWKVFWTSRSRHLVNMDGLEWKRAKYNNITKKFLYRAEKLAVSKSCRLIADNEGIEDYLNAKYDKPVSFIPYGAVIPDHIEKNFLRPYGLDGSSYDLVIARAEPENQLETVIRGKIASGDPIPLLIISNINAYWRQLAEKYKAQQQIIFHGPEYDRPVLDSLRYHSRSYIHGHSVGGTNPSLLEAMACSCHIIAHDNPFNRSVTGEDALYFNDENDLAELFVKHPAPEVVTWKENNLEKIRIKYNWELVTDAYERAFLSAASH